MLKKSLGFIITLSKSFLVLLNILFLSSCTLNKSSQTTIDKIENQDSFKPKIFKTRCEKDSRLTSYELGDLPCTKEKIIISKNEKLEIRFVIKNKKSEDPYEYGYQELTRVKNNKVVEKIKLRKEEDAYWSEVPFVRIRKQQYLSDLDGDGFLEFAVFPFHPGSALWMTARIYSLKDTIQYWGKGRYRFEADTYVKLGCDECSKFNLKECKKCY